MLLFLLRILAFDDVRTCSSKLVANGGLGTPQIRSKNNNNVLFFLNHMHHDRRNK